MMVMVVVVMVVMLRMVTMMVVVMGMVVMVMTGLLVECKTNGKQCGNFCQNVQEIVHKK